MNAMLVDVSVQKIERMRQDLPPVRGILGPDRARRFRLQRIPPTPDLAWCIEHHWIVEWDLPAGVEHRVDLLAHPSQNLAFEYGQLLVYGVCTDVFTRVLRGTGRVYGCKFRPGGFRPFYGAEPGSLTDVVIPATDVWPDALQLHEQLQGAVEGDQLVEAVEAFLRSRPVEVDPLVAEVGGFVQALLTDPDVRRVSEVCSGAGTSTRTLQRLFRNYVGVTPRWVLQRGRLFEAAAQIARDVITGGSRGWASLAIDLGYADQAHFSRDFRDAVGQTPARYAAKIEKLAS
jgi:AraC-like DNA-binding protein